MTFVRSSKYRHVFGTSLKDNYTGIKVTRNSTESKFCAANPKFVAIVLQGAGGGPFLVLPLDKVGRLPTDAPTVNGHKDKVIDLAWSPFNDNLLASCSEDCSVMIWEIPEDGLKETMKEPWVKLEGHEKRVHLLEWHPTADYILASAGNDNKILIWDVSSASIAYTLECDSVSTCISWNFNGSLMASTFKNKTLRVFDVRKEKIVQEADKEHFFTGTKPSKCVFLKDGRIFAVGFSKMSQRSYSFYDLDKSPKPLVTEEVDNASGTVYLHYDPDNNIVFTIGKGDSQIKYYEITKEEPYVHFLSLYQSTTSQRGFGWMPKRGLQVAGCEIARCFKLTEEKCEVINLAVPRKSELFQEDIFPPCVSDEPALSADEWIAGKDANPRTMSMKTLFDQQKGVKGGAAQKSNKPTRSLSLKTPKAAFSVAASGGVQNGTVPPGIDISELAEDVKKLKGTMRKVCRRLTALEKQLGDVVADDAEEEEEEEEE